MFGSLPLIVFAAVASFSSRAIAQQCDRTYVVKSGDVCDTISQQQGVSTFQLALVNPQINEDCTNLDIGEVLCLGLEGQDCRTVHTVLSTDTCDTITAAAQITLNTLRHNNPNIDQACDNLRDGEVLCTSSIQISF